jgi:ankyrin repeat protein
MRVVSVLALTLFVSPLHAQDREAPQYPSFDCEVARTHEIKPHRRTIPTVGARTGFNQLRLTLIVSPNGEVLQSDGGGDPNALKFWPQLQGEVNKWKFTPFEKDGKPVTAEIEEYLDLVPPERLPKRHVAAPILKPNSRIEITLQRTGCYGSCPGYTVTVSSDGIVFEGRSFVVASGRHTDSAAAGDVQKLAKRFIAADFYSMDAEYRAAVTDNPTYVLSIDIDGRKKVVEDYVGQWEGMPAIITDFEQEVDAFARTERWIEGSDGLASALQDERFNFHTLEAQAMLREAATRGKVSTVRELLAAGVPLDPLPAPKPDGPDGGTLPAHGGWLTFAGRQPEVLQILIDAKASKDDQIDKDLALVNAARSGEVAAARALIAYGANPNADLSKRMVSENAADMEIETSAAGSLLIYAAASGDPEMIREILQYHPKLEGRDREGKTALFAAAEYGYGDKKGARVQCVRILAEAGADINARDAEGNTPLHETVLTDVEEELLRLGADVNARNNDGETPIFTTYDDHAIALFIQHGADLTIQDNDGRTVFDAAKGKGPLRQEALRVAVQKQNQP